MEMNGLAIFVTFLYVMDVMAWMKEGMCKAFTHYETCISAYTAQQHSICTHERDEGGLSSDFRFMAALTFRNLQTEPILQWNPYLQYFPTFM